MTDQTTSGHENNINSPRISIDELYRRITDHAINTFEPYDLERGLTRLSAWMTTPRSEGERLRSASDRSTDKRYSVGSANETSAVEPFHAALAPAVEHYNLSCFIADIRRLREAVGSPSFAQIETYSSRLADLDYISEVRLEPLPKSTVHSFLTGNRRRLPRWGWVASLVLTLTEIASQNSFASGYSEDEIDYWKEKYEAVDSDPYAAALRRLNRAQRAHHDVWWHDFRDVVPAWCRAYLTLERELDLIRVYAPDRVPGLLQTPAYARHVIADALPGITAAEMAQRIKLRQVRQQLLRRPDAPRYWAVIHQRAIDRQDIPPAVLQEQRQHLISMATYPRICLQFVSETDPKHSALAGPIMLMQFPERTVGDIVYLEQEGNGIYAADEETVNHFSILYTRLTVDAMEPQNLSLLENDCVQLEA